MLKKEKKEEPILARIEEKFIEDANQITQYMKGKRMQGRPNLKKFVVVFSGFEVAKMEEIL